MLTKFSTEIVRKKLFTREGETVEEAKNRLSDNAKNAGK